MPYRTCSVDGCQRKHKARSWCNTHYRQWQMTGNPIGAPRAKTFEQQMKLYTISVPGECLLWTGALDSHGYALMSDLERAKTSTVKAHRFIYKKLIGPIADGLEVDHACHSDDLSCMGGDNCLHRRCVNVDHYELVTKSENIRRGMRSWERLGTCRRGLHDVTETENVLIRANGGRLCKPCYRESRRAYFATYVRPAQRGV